MGRNFHAEDDDLGDAFEGGFVVVGHDFNVLEPAGVGSLLPGREN